MHALCNELLIRWQYENVLLRQTISHFRSKKWCIAHCAIWHFHFFLCSIFFRFQKIGESVIEPSIIFNVVVQCRENAAGRVSLFFFKFLVQHCNFVKWFVRPLNACQRLGFFNFVYFFRNRFLRTEIRNDYLKQCTKKITLGQILNGDIIFTDAR